MILELNHQTTQQRLSRSLSSSTTLRSLRSLGDVALSPSAHPRLTRGYGVPDPAGLPPKFALAGELPISPRRYPKLVRSPILRDIFSIK